MYTYLPTTAAALMLATGVLAMASSGVAVAPGCPTDYLFFDDVASGSTPADGSSWYLYQAAVEPFARDVGVTFELATLEGAARLIVYENGSCGEEEACSTVFRYGSYDAVASASSCTVTSGDHFLEIVPLGTPPSGERVQHVIRATAA